MAKGCDFDPKSLPASWLFSIGLDPQGNPLVTSNNRVQKLTVIPAAQPAFGLNGIVNTASLTAGVAPGTWASLFGAQLTSMLTPANTSPLPTVLDARSIQLIDRSGNMFQAPLQFVAPNQINFLVPSEVAVGPAQISVVRQGVSSVVQSLTVLSQSPGVFTANASGSGVAAGYALFVSPSGQQQMIPLFIFDSNSQQYVFNPTPIPTDGSSVYIEFYGTGWNGIAANAITAIVGGVTVPVTYAGPQGQFIGLNQINIGPLPTSFKQKPGVVNVQLSAESSKSNVIQIGVF